MRAVLEVAAGKEASDRCTFFCGDVVPAKKPAPDVYLLALDKLGLDRTDTLVLEDSRNGLRAATAADLPCLVTVNGYTKDEDMSEAVLVVSELGDPDAAPIEVLADRANVDPGDYITLDDLKACMREGVR